MAIVFGEEEVLSVTEIAALLAPTLDGSNEATTTHELLGGSVFGSPTVQVEAPPLRTVNSAASVPVFPIESITILLSPVLVIVKDCWGPAPAAIARDANPK